MNITPSISVITCLYNCPPELFEKCIKGLISQTFKNFEVLIVNDGSTKYLDDNKKIIEKYCGNDNRFKYYDKEHSGKSQTLNFALRIAQGKYIAINDSDDVSLPERLEYQYLFLEDNQEYEVISNAMKAIPSNIIFPGELPSGKVTKEDIYYKASHPSMMFNRETVLSKVPFLFEQIYDSMEDNIFNHIMFYDAQLSMYYDNNVLVEYSQLNPDAVHYENLYGYKKEGSFKFFFNTFNNPAIREDAKFTTIILLNKHWKEELEKTIINIRFTADNTKILIINYDDCYINEYYYEKYDVTFETASNYADAINRIPDLCTTEYLMVVSKPIRFYVHNWDLLAIRQFKINPQYLIVQPYMTGIDKLNRDDYYNENGKIEKDYCIRAGEDFILLDKVMTKKRDHIEFYSEYTDLVQIPILDDDLIFITTKTELLKIWGAIAFDDNLLLNAYMSIKEYLCGGNIYIDANIKCGVLNNHLMNDYGEKETNAKYLRNMWIIAYIFLNESLFIYEKIISDNIKNVDDGKYIIESVITNKDINELKQFKWYKTISYFLKNINLKYNIWNLTWINY